MLICSTPGFHWKPFAYRGAVGCQRYRDPTQHYHSLGDLSRTDSGQSDFRDVNLVCGVIFDILPVSERIYYEPLKARWVRFCAALLHVRYCTPTVRTSTVPPGLNPSEGC